MDSMVSDCGAAQQEQQQHRETVATTTARTSTGSDPEQYADAARNLESLSRLREKYISNLCRFCFRNVLSPGRHSETTVARRRARSEEDIPHEHICNRSFHNITLYPYTYETVEQTHQRNVASTAITATTITTTPQQCAASSSLEPTASSSLEPTLPLSEKYTAIKGSASSDKLNIFQEHDYKKAKVLISSDSIMSPMEQPSEKAKSLVNIPLVPVNKKSFLRTSSCQELSTNSGAPRTLKTLFHTFESFPDQRVQLSIESSNSSSGSTAFDIISDIRIPQRENLEVSESPNIRSDFWQRYCTSELICKYCNDESEDDLVQLCECNENHKCHRTCILAKMERHELEYFTCEVCFYKLTKSQLNLSRDLPIGSCLKSYFKKNLLIIILILIGVLLIFSSIFAASYLRNS